LSRILYLVHRIPFPPNKGDKVRSFHLLKYLSSRHDVYLGTFVDDPADWKYVAPVEKLCTNVYFSKLNPLKGKLRSLIGFFVGKPLTLEYYFDVGLKRWVNRLIQKKLIDKIIIFSSAMSQYVDDIVGVEILVDFVDVDSLKWAEYAENHGIPMSWIYRREASKLLAYERFVANRSKCSFFVTDREASLFRELAPESAERVTTINNGVDADYFAPDIKTVCPFPVNEVPAFGPCLVFTGAMDYWPNVDAVVWFVQEVLPGLRSFYKNICFYIVGRNPVQQVLGLASDVVVVTGTVSDVRPYLQFATVVVAPLRVARGIQNKILEAMAMGRPVVASTTCVSGMDVDVGVDLFAADSANEFVEQLQKLIDSADLANSIGDLGRRRVLESYSWNAHLSKINNYLDVAVS